VKRGGKSALAKSKSTSKTRPTRVSLAAFLEKKGSAGTRPASPASI